MPKFKTKLKKKMIDCISMYLVLTKRRITRESLRLVSKCWL